MLLSLAALSVAYARTLLSPVQEALRVDLALSDDQLALLQGPALAIPVALAAIPQGLLIDRYPRVVLLLIFAVLDLAGTLLTACASNFVVLFAARCLVGLSVAATSMTAFSLLADIYAPEQRGRAGMIIGMSQYAGFSAAFALGGVLLGAGGAVPGAWRGAMLALSAPLVLVIFVMMSMREPQRTGSVLKSPSVKQAFAQLWHYRATVAPILCGIVMAEIMILTVLPWAAPALSRGFSLSPQAVGALMASVLLASGIAGPVIGGFLADVCQRRGGPRLTMIALSGLGFLCLPAAFFAKVADLSAASAMLLVLMTIGNASLTAATALFTIVIPNEIRGLCLALSGGSAVLLGLGLAPVVVSSLSGVLGGPHMLGQALSAVCAVTSVLLGTTFLLGTRYVSRVMGG